MIPLMYDYNEKFLITLTDCIKCEVEEEINGVYESSLTYPVSGKAYSQIQVGNYISCKANDKNEPQMFFIYKISKPIMGAIDIYCKHVRYKLNDYVVPPITYQGSYQFLMDKYLQYADERFSAHSNISGGNETIEVNIPRACSEFFMGETNSMLSRSHGEFEFDNYNIILYSQRGNVQPISVEYGKNLTGFSCDSDTSSAYSHIYPYYYQEDTENADNSIYVELPEKEMKVPDGDKLPFKKTMIVDLSSEFESKPTVEELRHQADLYVKRNKIAAIDLSFQVEFIPLSKTEEYKKLSQLTTLSLGDTINIHHKPLGIDVQSRVIKLTYDSLTEKIVSMNLGDYVADYSGTVLQTIKSVQSNVDKTIDTTKKSFKNMVNDKASLITGNKGGYIVYRDTDGDGLPDEQLIMDKPSITTAENVWRWNKGGFGHSSDGYSGKYDVAITMDGSINANFITTGVINADMIKAGYLTDTEGNFKLDMKNGQLTIKVEDGKLSLFGRGLTLSGSDDKTHTLLHPNGLVTDTIQLNESGLATGMSPIHINGYKGITFYNNEKTLGKFTFNKTDNSSELEATNIECKTFSCDNITNGNFSSTIYTPYGITLKNDNTEYGAFYVTVEKKAALKADFLIIDNKQFSVYNVNIDGQEWEILGRPKG